MRCSLLFAIFFLASGTDAQSNCPPLVAPAPDPARLLFTPGQESELGEIIREQLEGSFRVIEDDQVTAYLKRIGGRVAQHLPDTGLHYDFLLYDQPEVQAFSMPGGRVYVSRKMVSFLRNEDELAGLLGHELGHLAARQQALEMSRDFREVLGLKTLSVENVRLKKRRSQPSGEEARGQKIADQLGVQSVARSGYAPQAFPDLLDRLMQTKGRTGNWFTDLFGATGADSKRLREALKDIATLPASCVEAKGPVHSEEFHQWQAAVLHYRGIGHVERLTGVISRKQLNNPLRGDIEHFRFSPNGKYLLAQDEGGIYVLSRDPLKFIFRFDAADAQPAQFSPDSRQVVFFSSGLRVETWDLERQEQTSVSDVPALRGCRQTELSPDAKFLACFDNSLDLALYDVGSGEVIFKKDKFYDFDSGLSGYGGFFKLLYFFVHRDVVTLRFSPDGRYFAASSRTKEEVVIDLTTRKKINVPDSIHTAMQYSFTFAGPDRIVGVDTFSPQKSPLVEFPSGKVIDRMPLGGGSLVAATNPKYILIRPFKTAPSAHTTWSKRKWLIPTAWRPPMCSTTCATPARGWHSWTTARWAAWTRKRCTAASCARAGSGRAATPSYPWPVQRSGTRQCGGNKEPTTHGGRRPAPVPPTVLENESTRHPGVTCGHKSDRTAGPGSGGRRGPAPPGGRPGQAFVAAPDAAAAENGGRSKPVMIAAFVRIQISRCASELAHADNQSLIQQASSLGVFGAC